MGKQANPDRIRKFQQDAELLNSKGWNVTMIANEIGVNPSNLSANINFKEVTVDSGKVGKRPGSDIINKFYNRFQLEIERLKPGVRHLSQEIPPEFNPDGGKHRIRELEESKKYLEQQLAVIISNNTLLANSNVTLTNNNAVLTSNNGNLSKAYVELALQAKHGPSSTDSSSGEAGKEM